MSNLKDDSAMDVDENSAPNMSSSSTTATKLKKTPAASDELQLPWVEKYRPKRLEDLVAHDDIISILTKLIDSDNLPHLLLYGPPGTGKTSTIVAAAKRMYGSAAAYSSMALELNASDARGIDVVRNEIKEFAGTRQLFNKGIKLIILDEADSMTNDAQFALRRVIEKYTKNARFCLICNYVSKIIPALQSRCTRFRFAPLSRAQIHDRLVEVATAEDCKTTDDGIDAILALAGGDMRRVLNLLQSTAMSSEVIDQTSVYLTSGAPLPADMTIILDLLFNHPFTHAYENVVSICSIKGYALADVLEDLTVMITAMELPPGILADLLDGMSNVEHRLAFGTDEKIQAAALVGVFAKARQVMTKG
uniref:AAA+ ATPase domain-containing protein n=1 Tax=Attheya septentrionalis TaxID=420275 RepID=A0A6T7FPT8_9STRA|mmetsp:Transcript_14819/g.26884  ORF Transcript_14819/g.26884 Transcript_14819/m.26884 type:complete len:363 (+) Transcript_14819:136-1224(+)|eukprot:CAMPEP_0198299308 /NCGR_PEP_ID=MMETSP1449-20131203/44248_1 /TAXON_ID=420275 /ORGANISM="Attheya septentrionalis, Strain CCMP2084" /LENGTH=362 /DNA_ID=CAMNT_0044000825 /DNA_START=121 /DNA_END=1209 /DNA_ORIENTATION=-